MIRINVIAVTELTKMFLPAMVRRGRGQILNVLPPQLSSPAHSWPPTTHEGLCSGVVLRRRWPTRRGGLA